jgi:hypothetical protein
LVADGVIVDREDILACPRVTFFGGLGESFLVPGHRATFRRTELAPPVSHHCLDMNCWLEGDGAIAGTLLADSRYFSQRDMDTIAPALASRTATHD